MLKSRRCSQRRTPRSEIGLQLPAPAVLPIVVKGEHGTADFPAPMLPAADPIADQSAGASKVKVAGTAKKLLLRPTPRRSARSARRAVTSMLRAVQRLPLGAGFRLSRFSLIRTARHLFARMHNISAGQLIQLFVSVRRVLGATPHTRASRPSIRGPLLG